MYTLKWLLREAKQIYLSEVVGLWGTEPRGDVDQSRAYVCSVQEEVPDARRLDPGDVGSSAGEHAGFVLHVAADGTEAHHAVHLPAVVSQLAQEGTTRVALGEERGKNTWAVICIPGILFSLSSILCISDHAFI